MASAQALLVPNPQGIDIAIPIEVQVGGDGRAPERISYDGEDYRLIEGVGPAGQALYEHLD